MANPTVSITWTYTTDPLVLAALGGFNVYALDPTSGKPIAQPIAIQKNAPYAANVSLPGYAKQTVRVVPFDLQGTEGVSTDKVVYIPLPAVSSISQVLV